MTIVTELCVHDLSGAGMHVALVSCGAMITSVRCWGE